MIVIGDSAAGRRHHGQGLATHGGRGGGGGGSSGGGGGGGYGDMNRVRLRALDRDRHGGFGAGWGDQNVGVRQCGRRSNGCSHDELGELGKLEQDWNWMREETTRAKSWVGGGKREGGRLNGCEVRGRS